jgi:hypothetical protein
MSTLFKPRARYFRMNLMIAVARKVGGSEEELGNITIRNQFKHWLLIARGALVRRGLLKMSGSN